jgi:hypothetical protein
MSALRMPGDLRARAESPRVKELAESIDQTGGRCIHVPVVDKRTMSVVCGRDRVAAHHLRGAEEIEIEYVEVSPIEAEVLESAENLHRRTIDAATTRGAYLDALARLQLEAAEQDNAEFHDSAENSPPPKRRGRPASVEGKATKAVAKRLGVSERTVKRHAQEEQQEPLDVATWDVAVPQATRDDLLEFRHIMKGAIGALSRARADLKALEGHPCFAKPILLDLKHTLKKLETELPGSVCPWCKCHPALIGGCTACGGKGWVTASMLDVAPKELVGHTPVLVAVNGRFVQIDTVKAPKKKATKPEPLPDPDDDLAF